MVGFHSNLPIKFQDEIVFFICGSYGKIDDIHNIEPSEIIEPICLPIFGKYNEYGSIENIVYDSNVQAIEKTFNMPIEKIINAIENGAFCTKGTSKFEDYEMILTKLLDSQYVMHKENFSLCVTMEHKSVYDTMSSLFAEDNAEIENKLNDVLEVIKGKEYLNIFNPHRHKYDLIKSIELIQRKIDNKMSNEEFMKTLTEDEMNVWNQYQEEHHKFLKIDYKLDMFEAYSTIKDFSYSMIMYNNVEIDFIELKNDILKFLYFNRGLKLLCGKYITSSYGLQALTYFKKELMTMHKCYGEIIEKLEDDSED